MKLTILCPLLLFFSISVTAQYVPFPDSVASWSLKLNPYQEEPYTQNEFGYIQEITGDTMMIDGQTYLKVFQRLTWWKEDYFYEDDNGGITEYHISGNFDDIPLLIGGLRQDIGNKKVYFIRPSTVVNNLPVCIQPFDEEVFPLDEEFVLFDFDLEIGDTVTLGGGAGQDFHITQIDSVQYNDGIFRKRYEAENSFPDFSFIEGIGTGRGLFAPLRGDFVEGNYCNLNCFSTNGNYLIGDGIYGCDSIDVVSPVVEINQQTKIIISPNPFNNLLQLKIESDQVMDYQVVLFDMFGRVLKSKSVLSYQNLNVETVDLAPGIYFVSIYADEQLLTSQKVLKLE